MKTQFPRPIIERKGSLLIAAVSSISIIFARSYGLIKMVEGSRPLRAESSGYGKEVCIQVPKYLQLESDEKKNGLTFSNAGGPQIVWIQTVRIHYSAINFLVPKGLHFIV